MGSPAGPRVVTCPRRFDEAGVVLRWLAEIVGFDPAITRIAREVPFMQAVANPDRAAGRIDLVLAQTAGDALDWYGLEIQAVYFSGPGMGSEFDRLSHDVQLQPPFPDKVRRPDWRSSSAKRFMPQLQVKVPTLRRWGLLLDESGQKLLAAETVRRIDFEQALQSRLQPLLHSRQ